jgi:hypothetical protein
VSRVSPVQTALRNCTRDEGRFFEVGNQVLISSHRKPLLSKATVVNVAETAIARAYSAKPEWPPIALMSASTSYGHAGAGAYVKEET